jgi:phospholipase C
MHSLFRPLTAVSFAAAFAAAGCGSSGGGGGSAVPPQPISTPTPARPAQKIQHVVILIQENRTFDNLFNGYPGADTQSYGYTSKGKKLALKRHPLDSKPTPRNGYEQFVVEFDQGKMDGFDIPDVEGQPGTYVYQYVNPADVKPYWDLAKQYVLADRLFQTQGSGSFTAHQDLIAGGTLISPTEALIDNPSNQPWGCDATKQNPKTVTSLISTAGVFQPGAGPFPCLDYKTLRDLLDAKGVSWKYYTPQLHQSFAGNIWNAFDAIRAVRYGPEWKSNIAIPATLLTDISGGKLRGVSWVCPEFDNSDHPGAGDTGPSWIAQVVNAIGGSQYWNTTAVVVLWDDWGGFYDHVPPPQLDYQGLGFRVPMLIVSPYAKKGRVSHTRYEFGSVVQFVEDNWKLGRLGTTDVRANSLDDAFDFSQGPRPFAPIQAKYSQSYFLHQSPSNRPLDDE